jgi:type IV secretory pathway VirB9-like protein
MCIRDFIVGSAFGMVIGLTAAPAVMAQTNGVREVSASERSVIPLQARLRYTTMIVLPDEEEILDVICGDRDFWVVSATQNIVHVKPAKEGAATNLNLVTASGSVYSFLLSEKKDSPDLKVYVNGDENASPSKRKYYTAAQVEALEGELRSARAAVEASGRRADEAIVAYRQEYPSRLQFSYGTLKYEKPFLVRSIWHDGQFTYIKADARDHAARWPIGSTGALGYGARGGTGSRALQAPLYRHRRTRQPVPPADDAGARDRAVDGSRCCPG